MGTDSGDDSDMMESISTFWKAYFSKPKPKKHSGYTTQPCSEKPNCLVQYSTELSNRLTNSYNREGFVLPTPQPNSINSGKVWIYNISAVEHTISHPLLNGEKTIPAKKFNEKYVVWTSFPNMISQLRDNADAGSSDVYYENGIRFAMDLIDPDNLGRDQNKKVTARIGSNRNLGEKGVFWSVNNPPKPEELLAARKRMGKFYKRLLEEVGTKIFTSGMTYNEKVKALVAYYRKDGNKASTKELKQLAKLKLANWLTITPEHHAAAEYFKENTEWHPISETRLRRTK